MARAFLVIAGLLVLAACTPDRNGTDDAVGGGAAAGDVPMGETPAREWRSSPATGVRLEGSEPVRVETGPHTLLFPADNAPVSPPYTVRATLQKERGRLHEGFGVLFGGQSLDAPEEQQQYSYFLLRGDGSFLIKRRDGASTTVVRDWTRHPAIPRDTEEGGQPAGVAVHVGPTEVQFEVNGEQVATVPTAELLTRGAAGIRVAHDVQLSAANFSVTPGQ